MGRLTGRIHEYVQEYMDGETSHGIYSSIHGWGYSVGCMQHIPPPPKKRAEPLQPNANPTLSLAFRARGKMYHINWPAILQVTTVPTSHRLQPPTLACAFPPHILSCGSDPAVLHRLLTSLRCRNLQVLKAKELFGGISIAPFQPCSQFYPPVNAMMPSPGLGSGISALPSEFERDRKAVWSIGFCARAAWFDR